MQRPCHAFVSCLQYKRCKKETLKRSSGEEDWHGWEGMLVKDESWLRKIKLRKEKQKCEKVQ